MVGGRKASVLLVDDRPENLLSLEAMLERPDLNLVRALSGDEALRSLLESDFAVILLDVQMPGMDGFETAGLIRQSERSRHTPIIFLTATNLEDRHVFTGYEVGAVDYLFKPIVPEILRAKVAVFVDLFVKTEQIEVQRELLRLKERERETAMALARQTEDLKRSNADLEQFASVASHDLQEPLHKISGFAEILLERYQGQLDADADRFLGHLVDSAQRMQALINSFLTYSRVGSRDMTIGRTDSGAALGRALKNLETAVNESGAEVTADKMPTVPADETQMAQLFQNLVGNAIKYRGPDPPQIHVSATAVEDNWVFSVRDNGTGIDPRFQERLFKVFQSLPSGSEHDGTGIGLALCKRIVELHGGRIWMESEPGEGSTFFFMIPVSKGDGGAGEIQ